MVKSRAGLSKYSALGKMFTNPTQNLFLVSITVLQNWEGEQNNALSSDPNIIFRDTFLNLQLKKKFNL